MVSNPANSFSEVFHKTKCKYRRDDKKYETSGIKYKYLAWFPEYKAFKYY